MFYFCLFGCQDLKSEKMRAQMGSARAILERSTMMLLTSCKVIVNQDVLYLKEIAIYLCLNRLPLFIGY